MLHFLNPRGPQTQTYTTGQGEAEGYNQNSHFISLSATLRPLCCSMSASIEGGERGEVEKGKRRKSEARGEDWPVCHTEPLKPTPSSLPGAFHVCHWKLPGLNTVLCTHWEHYCYRKMKDSFPKENEALLCFSFSTIIMYSSFFSEILLNSSKALGSTCWYHFISGPVSSWCFKENVRLKGPKTGPDTEGHAEKKTHESSKRMSKERWTQHW